MCDCFELGTDPLPDTLEYQEPTGLAIDQLPDISEYGLGADPYAYILDMAHSTPQLDVPITMFDSNAPSLASIDDQMHATTLNSINANPGFEARYDSSTGSVAYFAPGDLTPSF